MNSKIFQLPETVINQIAAGEVVENPASIVKELIENSLDAGARHLMIEIISGGQQLIRIEDDGCGMGPEDAVRCLARHATSKIRSVDDLQRLSTMGFRGEALAAISSVSHFELKTSDGVTATRVLAEGGTVKEVEPCARNQGTTIEVRSLFYNVPARKKFQKSAAANTTQVIRTVEMLSLAHPEISFSLISNGKKGLDLKPASLRKRIEEVLGEHEHEVEGVSVKGFIGAPAKALSNRTGQYLFINSRPIFSPLIAKAVKCGFGTRIAEQAYPSFVLFLEISPEEIDVNVHPQKKEARFKEEAAIFQRVQSAVEKAFEMPHVFSEPLSFSSPSPFLLAETVPQPLFKMEESAPQFDFTYQDRPLTLLGPYLLLQSENLLLVDLAAAHARVLFESLNREKAESQALIWPLEIALIPGEEEVAEELNQMGIECRVLNKTLVVDALPPFLEAAHFPRFFESWKQRKKIDQVANYFCRGLKRVYLVDEAMALWNQLKKCRDTLYDPLGKPIWKVVTQHDLEKML